MAIKLSGKMSGNDIKSQLENIAAKGDMCENLTTSFKGVSNPICTYGDITGTDVQSWVSLLVISLYCWENSVLDASEYPVSFSTTNRILDMFKNCKSNVGKILYEFAHVLGNNFDVFPLSHLRSYNTFDEIFNSADAVDDICSFYPLYSIVDYMFRESFEDAAEKFKSKIYCIKDGYFWSGYTIENGYQSGTGSCLCGVYVYSDWYEDPSEIPDASAATMFFNDGNGVVFGYKLSGSTYHTPVIFSGFGCFSHIAEYEQYIPNFEYPDDHDMGEYVDAYARGFSSIMDNAYSRGIVYANIDVDAKSDGEIDLYRNSMCYSSNSEGWVSRREYESSDSLTISENYDFATIGCTISVENGVKHISNISLYDNDYEYGIGAIRSEVGLQNFYFTIGEKK